MDVAVEAGEVAVVEVFVVEEAVVAVVVTGVVNGVGIEVATGAAEAAMEVAVIVVVAIVAETGIVAAIGDTRDRHLTKQALVFLLG